MFCSKCGARNDDTANFCMMCSHPLNQAAQAPQTLQAPPFSPAQQPLQNQPQWPTGAQPPNSAGYPQMQPQQPSMGRNTPKAKRKNPLLWIVLGLLGFVIAFVVWANLSPDTTQASASPEASVAVDGTTDETVAVDGTADETVAVAGTSDQAVEIARTLTQLDNLVFNHDEKIIKQEDGTYRMFVNDEELADVDCFVVGPAENGETLYELDDYFFVLKDTSTVLRLNFTTSLLEPVTGPVTMETRGEVAADPAASEAEASTEAEASAEAEPAQDAGGAAGNLDADGTLAFLKDYAGDTSLEFLREENFIEDPDGLRVVEMDDSQANVACYLYAPAGYESSNGYVGFYAVRVGTTRVYAANESDPGLMRELPAK